MAPKTREIAESVWDAVALVELPAKKYFKIGEVAALVGVEPHVLRYWQTQFRQVRPQKSRSGHRQYRRRDVESLLAIKELLHVQRFTIAGARQALKSAPSTLPRAADVDSLLPQAAGETPPDAAAVVAPVAAPVAAAPVVAAPAAVAAPVPVGSASVANVTTQAGAAPVVETAPRPVSPVAARDDVAEFEVVGVETDSQLRRAFDSEFAEQSGASAQVEVATAEPAAAAPVPTHARVQPSVSDVTAPAVASSAPLPERAVAPEVELGVPRRRRSLVSQQLGFGFVPTAHEVLVAARREALELLEHLDREDAADRRHLGSKV